MNDFGPKRPMSEDTPCVSKDAAKAKRGRPKKKPDYDREKEIEAFQAKAVELFGEPYDDRIERSEDAPSIRDVANAMNTTPLEDLSPFLPDEEMDKLMIIPRMK